MPAGRPTAFKPEYSKQATKLCRLGATNPELADFFDVAPSTISKWFIDYPEFSEAVKAGKEASDAEVAHKLYRRAIGYSHKDVDIKAYEGSIIQTPIIKHYPPDPTSMIFWLKNRQPKKWREKQELGLEISKGQSFKIGDQIIEF